jgi:hypothetical protein
MSRVHGSWSSQAVGHVLGGSHCSPGSSSPSPHFAEQSVSVACMHPEGQQPSPDLQAVTGSESHAASHRSGEPMSLVATQALTAGHSAGQVPSHNSPGSTWPSPQRPLEEPESAPAAPARPNVHGGSRFRPRACSLVCGRRRIHSSRPCVRSRPSSRSTNAIITPRSSGGFRGAPVLSLT